MIEFAMIDNNRNQTTEWIDLGNEHDPQRFWFDIHIFRIGGIVYTENTPEFIKAFEQDVIMRCLKA